MNAADDDDNVKRISMISRWIVKWVEIKINEKYCAQDFKWSSEHWQNINSFQCMLLCNAFYL